MTELTTAKDYIHISSIGNLQDCKKFAGEAKKYLLEMYNKKKLHGIGLRIIKNIEMKNGYFIYHDLSEITKDKYPYIFLAVQHPEVEDMDISKWIEDRGFKLLPEVRF
jgi:hypothetical protein